MDMNDVPGGQVGEIVYRAPHVDGRLLVTVPQATAEAFAGGWFHSGDLVRQDEEGYVWVVDRKKDMIISGGENIYCAEVENVLAGHPAIVEVAVIGRAHRKWGEVPVAVAAVTQAGLTLADLHEFLTERLARYKHPKALEVVDALPRNPAGKVLKTELRSRFGVEDERSTRERKFFCTNGFCCSRGKLAEGASLPTAGGSFRWMRCTAGSASGTVLWSALLLASKESVVTHTGSGLGGGVRDGLPLSHDHRGLVVGVVW